MRNTAHWLIALLGAARITGDARFRDAAARAAGYLTAPLARPHGAAFFCRTNPNKDLGNGLIGQAWAIEALVAAAEQLEDASCRALGVAVFSLHPFDEGIGLWRRVHVDGRLGSLDPTFNHQLWFAAAGAFLDGDPGGAIRRQVLRFLDRACESHFRTAASGRILHRIDSAFGHPAGPAPRSGVTDPDPDQRAAQVFKEIGYHAFNLYALALLAERVPGHALWVEPRMRAALAFVATDEYLHGLEDNPYAYPYNPVGFEVAYALQGFTASAPRSAQPDHWWVARQLERCYDHSTQSMTRATGDPATSAARLYEATRLNDVELLLGA